MYTKSTAVLWLSGAREMGKVGHDAYLTAIGSMLSPRQVVFLGSTSHHCAVEFENSDLCLISTRFSYSELKKSEDLPRYA